MGSIGVDIGGTKISAGFVENGSLIQSTKIPTPVTNDEMVVIATIINAINEVWHNNVIAIGVGVPGLVDVENGIVYDVYNIPSFTDVNLKKILEDTFNVPVHLGNDANCFVLGAKKYDNCQSFKNIVGLTLGTGLGGGIIVNNTLHEGVGSGAGEFGYIPYLDGILEHYCSGQFFQRKGYADGQTISDLAAKKNKDALGVFNEFGIHLGEAIKIAAHVFAPEAIILGGSISKSYKYFEKSMWENIRKFPYRNVVDKLTVIPTSKPHLAIYGAATLMFQE